MCRSPLNCQLRETCSATHTSLKAPLSNFINTLRRGKADTSLSVVFGVSTVVVLAEFALVLRGNFLFVFFWKLGFMPVSVSLVGGENTPREAAVRVSGSHNGCARDSEVDAFRLPL